MPKWIDDNWILITSLGMALFMCVLALVFPISY